MQTKYPTPFNVTDALPCYFRLGDIIVAGQAPILFIAGINIHSAALTERIQQIATHSDPLFTEPLNKWSRFTNGSDKVAPFMNGQMWTIRSSMLSCILLKSSLLKRITREQTLGVRMTSLRESLLAFQSSPSHHSEVFRLLIGHPIWYVPSREGQPLLQQLEQGNHLHIYSSSNEHLTDITILKGSIEFTSTWLFANLPPVDSIIIDGHTEHALQIPS